MLVQSVAGVVVPKNKVEVVDDVISKPPLVTNCVADALVIGTAAIAASANANVLTDRFMFNLPVDTAETGAELWRNRAILL